MHQYRYMDIFQQYRYYSYDNFGYFAPISVHIHTITLDSLHNYRGYLCIQCKCSNYINISETGSKQFSYPISDTARIYVLIYNLQSIFNITFVPSRCYHSHTSMLPCNMHIYFRKLTSREACNFIV